MSDKETMKTKSFRTLERLVRSFANHRRIQILGILRQKPEMSVGELADELKINFKTAADHIRRLTIGGMLMKRSDGTSIRHKVTDRGLRVLEFLRILE